MAAQLEPSEKAKLLFLLGHFAVRGEVSDVQMFGSGHIHDTYLVKTSPAEEKDYILQCFNTQVFRDPDAVMDNTRRVTNHIREKVAELPAADLERVFLTLIPLKNGKEYFRDTEKKVWRVFEYIPDHLSYDRAENTETVYEGGKAYGNFLAILSDLEPGAFKDTIPDFHNLDWRLQQFNEALRNGREDRRIIAGREVKMVLDRVPEMRIIRELCLSGQIPLRLVHHDTKINNVLFSKRGKALCVIDLDTVMPGYVHDDFGDAIRTFTNTGEEDDVDTSKVSMNLDYFRAFATGYLEGAGSLLNNTEKEQLALSARVMTYMQTIRFLADYLNGDVYYKIHSPEHNLQRSRAQLALLLSMEEQYPEMCRIINSLG
ncbi:MAG: aminoglycoside phosphotransferase family protein [Bacteroidales bacterium]